MSYIKTIDQRKFNKTIIRWVCSYSGCRSVYRDWKVIYSGCHTVYRDWEVIYSGYDQKRANMTFKVLCDKYERGNA